MDNFIFTIRRWFLLILLMMLLCIFYYFDLHHYLNFKTIKNYHNVAQHWTENHYTYATGLYLLIFSLLIACAIPCATLFALLGGFLFGAVAIIYAVFATTLGGMILFLAVRTAISPGFKKMKSSSWMKKIEKGLQQNAFNYLLMLRLVPIFPCWISNVSAGILNIPLRTFLGATILGIFPATFIYVMVGRGLDKFFAGEITPRFSLIFTPGIFFPLFGLAILSIFPIIYKLRKRYETEERD